MNATVLCCLYYILISSVMLCTWCSISHNDLVRPTGVGCRRADQASLLNRGRGTPITNCSRIACRGTLVL